MDLQHNYRDLLASIQFVMSPPAGSEEILRHFNCFDACSLFRDSFFNLIDSKKNTLKKWGARWRISQFLWDKIETRNTFLVKILMFTRGIKDVSIFLDNAYFSHTLKFVVDRKYK